MILWILAGAITLVVTAAVIWPLLRGRAADRRAADYDIEVYRDQLAEVERNLAEGTIGRAEAEAAKAEIGRRILAADQRREQASTPGASAAGRLRRVAAAGLVVAIPAGALGLYGYLGSPGKPAMPLAERDVERGGTRTAQAPTGAGGEDAPDLAQAERRLTQRLAEEPADLDGWVLLGRTRMTMRRFAAAAEAFGRARALAPQDASVNAMYAEARILAADGTVTPQAEEALRAALRRNPDDPRAIYYLALADLQQGKAEAALDAWAGMVETAPADAPWLEVVERQMAAAERQLGIEPGTTFAEVEPTAPAPSGPTDGTGPTREQMQAARNMSPQQRRQMIRGMVETLAARLEENPRDFEGWQRLIRSYGVLGETAKAQQALETALATFEKAPFVRQQLAAQADRQGLRVPDRFAAAGDDAAPAQGQDGGTRGPSQEQIEAAGEMSPDQQRQMIESMVGGLAARLEQNPDDLQGWLMLARSYTVLEQPAKARDALARAAELAPRDVDVLTRYARALYAAAGNRVTDRAAEVSRQVLELAPDNPEALWILGLHHAAKGEREKARDMFDRAIAQLPPDSPQTTALRRRADEVLAN